MSEQSLNRRLLREVRPGDAAALAEMRGDIGLQNVLMANPARESGTNLLAETQAWIERRTAAGWFRVIDDGTGAVGFAQLADIHRKNRFAWFGIAVHPHHRGKGIGRRALEETESLARDELGLRKLLLQVRSDNDAAIALYDRSGWRRVGILAAHYDDGQHLHDTMVMEKLLT